MAGVYVLDTHALIWFLQGDPRLGPGAKAVISDPNCVLVIPAIVLAEAIWLVERGRTNIPSPKTLLEAVDADSRFRYAPLDRNILELTISLLAITEMHDRQIVATTLSLNSAEAPTMLLTMDAQIRASGLTPVLW